MECQRGEWDYLLEYDTFDPCIDNFQHRYVVGVNDATKENMKTFASDRKNQDYVRRCNQLTLPFLFSILKTKY